MRTSFRFDSWSRKTRQPGYAPECANKFVRCICNLPRIKCGDCPNQAFLPVDDAVLIAHLQGRHVMGVYPLLKDETCWFLASDFDKATWVEDVAAFADTCRLVGVPAVPASMARKMGCYLITETMSRRHELSMD